MYTAMIANVNKAAKFLVKKYPCQKLKAAYKKWLKIQNTTNLMDLMMFAQLQMPNTTPCINKEFEYVTILGITFYIWDVIETNRTNDRFDFDPFTDKYKKEVAKDDESAFMFRLHSTADALLFAKDMRASVKMIYPIYDFLIIHAALVTERSNGIHLLWNKIETMTRYITRSKTYRPEVLLRQIVTANGIKGMESVGYDASSFKTIFEKRFCGFCNMMAENMKRCSQCKTTYYCNEICQANHWKGGHKHVCKSCT